MMKRDAPKGKIKAKGKAFSARRFGGGGSMPVPGMGGGGVSRQEVPHGVARLGPPMMGASASPGLQSAAGGARRPMPPRGGMKKKPPSKGRTVMNAGLAGGGTMRAPVAGGG